jgi:hypothetical protein
MNGIVSESWRVMWRHRRFIYWVFLVSLVFAWISSRGVNRQISRVLDSSLASQDLAQGFDLSRFVELTKSPEVNFTDSAPIAVTLSFVFLVYMLFLTGGILEVYREDRRLAIEDFFAACGHNFWRFVRLMLWSLIPFAIAVFVGRLVRTLGATFASGSRGMILSSIAAVIVTVMLALLVRLWFDVAQVRAVAQDEHRMLRNLLRSAQIASNQLLALIWIYLRISLLAWLTLAVGAVIFVNVIPPDKWWLSFLWLELIVFAQLTTRFWQRAAAVKWYQRFAEEKPELALDVTTTQPQEIV